MKKKILKASMFSLGAVALVVVTVLTTMALLTSSSKVANVFTVGEVKISMYESKVNSDGMRVDASGNVLPENSTDFVKVDTNSYHLVPGKTYVKDPTIFIDSKEHDDMYLFVKSDNQIRSAEEGNFVGGTNTAETTEETAKTMREQMHSNGWVEYIRSGDGVQIVWVYGTRDQTTGAITPTAVNCDSKQNDNMLAGQFRLCDTFTIHEDAVVSVYGAASVTFTGFAIQATGFGADDESGHALTQAAWTAVKDSFPYDCGIVNPKNPYSNEEGDKAYEAVEGVEDPLPVNTQGSNSAANPVE